MDMAASTLDQTMLFNSKYSHTNNLFGELGYAIGCLGNSSQYDDYFIAIADRVVMLNEGAKVDQKALLSDIDTLFIRLEKEGGLEKPVLLHKEIAKENKQFNWSLGRPIAYLLIISCFGIGMGVLIANIMEVESVDKQTVFDELSNMLYQFKLDYPFVSTNFTVDNWMDYNWTYQVICIISRKGITIGKGTCLYGDFLMNTKSTAKADSLAKLKALAQAAAMAGLRVKSRESL